MHRLRTYVARILRRAANAIDDPPQLTVHLPPQGEMIAAFSARALAEKLLAFQADGGRITITP